MLSKIGLMANWEFSAMSSRLSGISGLASGVAIAALSFVSISMMSSEANANLVTNGSFEIGTLNNPATFDTLAAGSTAIADWSVGGAGVDYIGGYWPASDGSRSLDLSALNAGSVSQSISGLHNGHSYNLSFDIAANPEGGNPGKKLQWSGIFNGQLFNISNNPRVQGWVTISLVGLVYNAANGNLLTFLSGEHNPYGPALDNVKLVSAVPLPPAALLFVSALGGLGFLARRRSRRLAFQG